MKTGEELRQHLRAIAEANCNRPLEDMDSLDKIEFLMAVEDHYQEQLPDGFPDDIYEDKTTIEDLALEIECHVNH